MARYIDAEKIDFSTLKNDFDRARAKVMVMATPTADVVEVVRCKDCKHYKEYLHHSTKEPTGWGKCTSIEMDIDLASNDFCIYGERSDA